MSLCPRSLEVYDSLRIGKSSRPKGKVYQTHDLLEGLNAPVAGKRIAGRAVAKRDGGFFPSESGGLPRRSTECGVRGFRVELRSDIKLLRLERILRKARGQRHDHTRHTRRKESCARCRPPCGW